MNPRPALIVGAAPTPDRAAHYNRLVREADVVIAADGGLLVCMEAGRVPDVCVGDFDSTPSQTVDRASGLGAEIRRYPAEKDVSDLDLAVAVARERGCPRVTFTAAFGGRLDHTLAALGTVAAAADLGAFVDEPGWTAIPLEAEVRPTCELAMPVGTIVSILALGGPATVDAEGFAYPMRNHTLAPLSSKGLSNVAAECIQRVSITSGTVLVIVNRAASG